MPRKSSIDRLPAPAKAAIQKLLKNNQHTLEQIVELIRKEFGEAPSRSALGRYKKNFDEIAKDLRESREIAEVWAQKLGSTPDSDVGKVVLEVLKTLSYRVSADMMAAGSEERPQPKELAQLAKAMQYIEDAGRLSLSREKELRAAVLQEAASRVEKAAKAKGMGKVQAAFWREEVLKGL
jgi:hypothetical protein